MGLGSTVWDDEYARKGMIWSGMTHDLPELSSGCRVLELGCGNGKMLPVMIRREWNVTAIDFSCRAVALCRRQIGGALSGQVMVADARGSPFRNETFDAVFAIHCIGHMHRADRNQTAREIIRMLKPGGIMYFSGFATDDFRFGKGHETEAATFRRGNGIITHYFSRQEVIDLFLNLKPCRINIHPWSLRVRGNNLKRSEIIGIFKK